MKKLLSLTLALLLILTAMASILTVSADEVEDELMMTLLTVGAPVIESDKGGLTISDGNPTDDLTFDFEDLLGAYSISFKDAAYVRRTGENYYLTVESDAPADVLKQITYTCDGKAFTGASAPGQYVITASLPVAELFIDDDQRIVTELTATLTILESHLEAGPAEKPYRVILSSESGFSWKADLTATEVTLPESVTSGYALADAVAVKVTGIEGASYKLYLPTDLNLYALDTKEGRDGYAADNIFVYEGGKLVSLKDANLKAEVKDGYFEIDGLSGDTELTLVVVAHALSNQGFPWWIVVLVIVAILLVIYFIMLGVGKHLYKKKKEEEAEAKKNGDKKTETK